MPFGKIKNDALYELKYGLIDNAKKFKKTAIEMKDFAGRAMLYMKLAEYDVELPKEPDELADIIELDLSNKEIDKLPAGIEHLSRLGGLNLSGNNFTKFPKEIVSMKHLTYLDLSHNNLTKIPKEIGSLNHLTHLDLSHNNLTKLPKQVEDLNSLVELNINYNNIPNTDFISKIQRRCILNKNMNVQKDKEVELLSILEKSMIQMLLVDNAHLGLTEADCLEELNKHKSGN